MRLLKLLSFGLLALIIIALAAISAGEKLGFSSNAAYTSWWMNMAWLLLILVASGYIIKKKLHQRTAVFLVHASFILILAGAGATEFLSKSGTMQLNYQTPTSQHLNITDSTTTELPFSVMLTEFNIITYPGTSAPLDYQSVIEISENGSITNGFIAMNKVFTHHGFRFSQSSYNADNLGVTLSVYYDPVGITTTYAGYLLLLISIILFFFSPNTGFSQSLKLITSKAAAVVILLITAAPNAAAAPSETSKMVLPNHVASRIGDMPIYYNNRIAPFATIATDFTRNLCGKTSYRGMSALQVTTGFIFQFSKWKDEPIIKVKNRELRLVLGLKSDHASYNDFFNATISGTLDIENPSSNDAIRYAGDISKFESINMLVSGAMLKLFPVRTTNNDGNVSWFSPTDNLPMEMDNAHWLFIRKSLGILNELFQTRQYTQALAIIEKIEKYQREQCPNAMPESWKIKTEIIYNHLNTPFPLGIVCVLLGITAFVLCALHNNISGKPRNIAITLLSALWILLTTLIAMRWIISAHIPLSNGFETMQFMAWCATSVTLLTSHHWNMAIPFGFIVAGLTIMVSSFSGSGNAITPLMPVLTSPLLSFHVVVIMLSYALFTFMMLNGLMAFAVKRSDKNGQHSESLANVSRALLYPAVFLLAAGIFIGAVWANMSWGCYWNWDPKEVWALITMLVYSYPLHSASLTTFRTSNALHLYNIIAFITVLITYFGVNFLLGGQHSYA